MSEQELSCMSGFGQEWYVMCLPATNLFKEGTDIFKVENIKYQAFSRTTNAETFRIYCKKMRSDAKAAKIALVREIKGFDGKIYLEFIRWCV